MPDESQTNLTTDSAQKAVLGQVDSLEQRLGAHIGSTHAIVHGQIRISPDLYYDSGGNLWGNSIEIVTDSGSYFVPAQVQS